MSDNFELVKSGGSWLSGLTLSQPYLIKQINKEKQ